MAQPDPTAPAFRRERGSMLKWWKTNERRVVLAVRPVDERTVQIIRKGPFFGRVRRRRGWRGRRGVRCWACVVAGQRSGRQPSHLFARDERAKESQLETHCRT